MDNVRFEAPLDAVAADRRFLTRKKVLLSGVIADKNGWHATDCTIRNLNVRGALVQLPRPLSLGGELYLIDMRNETAYLASIAWIKAERMGLSFIRTYALTSALPSSLAFLWKLFIEAKLKQVWSLIARGIPVEEATRIVGVDEEQLEQFSERGIFGKEFALLLNQAKQLFRK